MFNFNTCSARFQAEETNANVTLSGKDLTICDVVRVARFGAKVDLTADKETLQRVENAYDYIAAAVSAGKPVYGVTTGFGGMAHTVISPEDAAELQENLIWFMKSEAGKRLAREDVRAAMVIRANTHLMGLSGLRFELIQRIAADIAQCGRIPEAVNDVLTNKRFLS